MPVFEYKGRAKTGEKVQGTVEAADRRAALVAIDRLGHVPVSVQQGRAPKKSAGAGKPFFQLWTGHEDQMSHQDLLLFTTELSDLLGSGMTLGNALNTLSARESGRATDRIVAGLRDEIVRGASLSQALGKYPKSFPTLYVSMVESGEASGGLAGVLIRIVRHLERVQEAREKVTSALVYPCIVLGMGILAVAFMMVYVVPKFEAVFQALGQQLPLSTRILIASSRWLADYGWTLIVAGAAGAMLFGRWRKTEQGRLSWDGLTLKLPLVKGVVASGVFANFARTLGTLLGNGVHVLQALTICERVVGNTVIAGEIRKARERVTDGTTISGPLSQGKLFPRMMTDMIAIGEQTGDMAKVLGHIATRYENELDRHVKILTTALEPMLVVFVAGAVGFVAVSMLMAVFSVTNGLGV